MIRHLLLTLCLAVRLFSQTDSDLEAALATAKDDNAARRVLAEAFDRGQANAVVAALAEGDRLHRYLNWREGPTADPLTAAILQQPHCIRLLAGRLESDDKNHRLVAARLVRWSNWPYLTQVLLERILVEKDVEVQIALYDGIRGTLKEDELRVVWQSKPSDATAVAARSRALFRLGLARSSLTHRVGAWPGGPDWTERGFSDDRSLHPNRKLIKSSVSLPKTQNRDVALYLLGYAFDSNTPVSGMAQLEILDGAKSLGTFDLYANPEISGLRILSFTPADALNDASTDLTLHFKGEAWESFRFRALVGIERSLSGAGSAFFTRRLLPGAGLSVEGAQPDEELRPGLLIEGDRAKFVIEGFDQRRKIHSFELDHWSSDQSGSVWELALNGRVLVQLIGQPRPRAAKCSLRNFKLEKGKNVVELRRLSGQALHVESIRLRFE